MAKLKAFITGLSGQDGSYLAELLESKDYEVHGLVRRSAAANLDNLKNTNATFHYGDICDESSIYQAIKDVMPDEVYHLAAQSFVKMSFITPVNTGDITALGTVRMLETLRVLKPDAKFYNAGSSEMFGAVPAPQTLDTPFHPISPYSVAKVYAHWITQFYRETYKMFAVNGICFNHESPRRGIEFVSRKIARGVADIAKGKSKELRLGNLEALRDWSHAKDIVRGMHLMMQHPTPENWLLASGESHTVRDFVVAAFEHVGLDWEKYVVIDPAYYRPNEVNHLCGDPSKARELLGWKPEYDYKALVKEMVDIELLKP